ncbi:MAG: catalase, partial [Acidobacteriota bacterium]
GAYPEWELGLQIFSEAEAEKFSFDVLDATKLVPEELVPVVPVGRMVLNRNPDNFFAETEQVAFCVAHVVPGIDFSNDPLLAGRIHSYVDTQISRLGGANFHELPINAPLAPVHNNQRDGMHRQTIARGRVAYEPNSLAGGCPFQAGAAAGFVSFPEQRSTDDHKVRGSAERFAEHYAQATLFWCSQTEVEKRHIIAAFRFELSKVQVKAIRVRMVSGLMNVAPELAEAVARGLGIDEMPAPMPKALPGGVKAEVKQSPSLSLTARPGDGSIRARKVAILVADGCVAPPLAALARRLIAEGAEPKFVGLTLATVRPATGDPIAVDASIETSPAVLFDGMVLADGDEAVSRLQADGRIIEFIKDQYRHCKTILALGKAEQVLAACRIDRALPDGGLDPGLILAKSSLDAGDAFVTALGQHRHFARETDPPRV